MHKEEIYELLRKQNIWYEVTEHQAVFNMNDIAKITLPYPEAEAKNLFICDDKKKNYYLITIKKDKKVDLKKFQQTHHTRRLSFASSSDLQKIMKLTPGSVSPLGLLNNQNYQINFYLDQDFLQGKQIIGIHPNDNTATIWLKVPDLITLIKEYQNSINIIEL